MPFEQCPCGRYYRAGNDRVSCTDCRARAGGVRRGPCNRLIGSRDLAVADPGREARIEAMRQAAESGGRLEDMAEWQARRAASVRELLGG